MSVCAGKRKALALLAIDALEAREAVSLRTHVETCAGCREYLLQIGQVTARLEAAVPAALAPSPLLRRRTRQALHRERPPPSVVWRLILPAAAMVFVLVILPRSTRQADQVAGPAAAPRRVARAEGQVSPTLLNYQMAANQSFDKLDGVLAEQARNTVPAAHVYRAGNWLVE
jgi:predicted anti-sigma-YlaC factor YlaD